MFEPGKLYRHIASLDIDIRVCAPPEDLGNRLRLKVMYWHRNYKYLMTYKDQVHIDTVHIDKDKFQNWREVTPDTP